MAYECLARNRSAKVLIYRYIHPNLHFSCVSVYRERQTDRHRQTETVRLGETGDRQADRQTETDRDRDTERQRYGETETDRCQKSGIRS